MCAVQVVDSLGFVAHPDKSTFIPSQRLEFLGFILNSVEMTIRLTREKATGLQTACNILLTDGLLSHFRPCDDTPEKSGIQIFK